MNKSLMKIKSYPSPKTALFLLLGLMIVLFLVILRPDLASAHQMTGAKEAMKRILTASKSGWGFIIISMLVSFLLGAMHALTPGHGKTVVATYLISSGGKIWDAVILGITVTITHISSVVVIGLVLLLASQKGFPPKVTPILGIISGLIIIIIGVWLIISLSKGMAHIHSHKIEDHSHSHNPDHHNKTLPSQGLKTHLHHHNHNHQQNTKQKVHAGIWNTLSIGISGGMIPCPAALVVLLMAVSMNKIVFGLSLIITFSLGLAAVLIILGVLFTTAQSLFQRYTEDNRFIRWLPQGSALIMLSIGIIIVVRSFLQIGL